MGGEEIDVLGKGEMGREIILSCREKERGGFDVLKGKKRREGFTV